MYSVFALPVWSKTLRQTLKVGKVHSRKQKGKHNVCWHNTQVTFDASQHQERRTKWVTTKHHNNTPCVQSTSTTTIRRWNYPNVGHGLQVPRLQSQCKTCAPERKTKSKTIQTIMWPVVSHWSDHPVVFFFLLCFLLWPFNQILKVIALVAVLLSFKKKTYFVSSFFILVFVVSEKKACHNHTHIHTETLARILSKKKESNREDTPTNTPEALFYTSTKPKQRGWRWCCRCRVSSEEKRNGADIRTLHGKFIWETRIRDKSCYKYFYLLLFKNHIIYEYI